MLDPNPDTRAKTVREVLATLGPRPEPPPAPGRARVGPQARPAGGTAQVAGAAQVAGSAQPAAGPADGAASAHGGGDGRGRHAKRRRRREERHARRREQRAVRRAASPLDRIGGWPPLFTVFAVIGLSLARLGVSLTLRVLVPIVLTVLSVVFGRGLIKAAREVRRAGRSASRVLKVAQDRVRGRPPGPAEDAKVRVEVGPEHQEQERVKGARIEEREAEEEMREALGEIEQAVQEAQSEARRRP
jgi:hypothetical protein